MFSMFQFCTMIRIRPTFTLPIISKSVMYINNFFAILTWSLFLSYLGVQFPLPLPVIKGYPNGETFYLYNKKTYWDNTLNSYEGISIITRKGLKNGY